MKRTRILSMILLVSVFFSLVSCKKTEKKTLIESIQYKSGQEVQETDPYFTAEIHELQLPIEEGREVKETNVQMYGFYGNLAVVQYYIGYVVPEGVDEGSLPDEEYQKYNVNGTGLFDAKGNYLKDILEEDIGLIYDVATDTDGNVCILGYAAASKEEKWRKVMAVIVFDQDGKEVRRITIQDAPFDAGACGSANLGFLPDGRYSIREENRLIIFDKNGTISYIISEPERIIGTGIVSKNGKNYVLSFTYSYEEGENIQLKEINIKTGELGKAYDVSGLAAFDDFYPTTEGLYVRSGTGCYEYDIENNKLVKFFDLSDTDVDRSLLSYTPSPLFPKDTDELYVVGLQFPHYYLIRFTRAEKNPHAGKKMLVVGGIDMSTCRTLMAFISEYNSDPQNKSRIVLVDYSEDLENGTSRADIENKVLQDVLAGDGPDILVNFSESASFQKTSVMEDLNPYLDGQNGIPRELFFDNVFRAQEKNGQLFHIPLLFELEGLMANTDYIPNNIGWTFDEFDEAASNVPDNVVFMEGLLYKDILTMLLSSTMTSFVDYDNKTCDFQNDTMKKYLQVARMYGVDRIAEDEGMMTYYDGNSLKSEDDLSEIKFMNGLITIKKTTVDAMDTYGDYRHNFLSPSTFLGYPSLDGSGATIKPYLSVGIVATSKYKDLSWDFLSSLLEGSGSMYRDAKFEVNREAFEADWESRVSQNGFYNEQDIEEVREMIEAANTTICYDAVMMDVITEEAAAYFAGDRSEEAVLKNIQNRCQLILNERG